MLVGEPCYDFPNMEQGVRTREGEMSADQEVSWFLPFIPVPKESEREDALGHCLMDSLGHMLEVSESHLSVGVVLFVIHIIRKHSTKRCHPLPNPRETFPTKIGELFLWVEEGEVRLLSNPLTFVIGVTINAAWHININIKYNTLILSLHTHVLI